MLSEHKYRGGFELGWPKYDTVLNRLDAGHTEGFNNNKDHSDLEAGDGSHLMTLEDAMVYEVYFQLVKWFESSNGQLVKKLFIIY